MGKSLLSKNHVSQYAIGSGGLYKKHCTLTRINYLLTLLYVFKDELLCTWTTAHVFVVPAFGMMIQKLDNHQMGQTYG